MGAAVGKPLEGHRECVICVACSPDGRHIISGSDDKTIRIWDAEIGAAVGGPLNRHSSGVVLKPVPVSETEDGSRWSRQWRIVGF
jgi:WD40 repeat protein